MRPIARLLYWLPALCLANSLFSQEAETFPGTADWLTLDAKSLGGLAISKGTAQWSGEHVFNGTKAIRWDYMEGGALTIPFSGEGVGRTSALFLAFQEFGSIDPSKPFQLQVLQGDNVLLSAAFRTRRDGWNRIELRCNAREKRVAAAFGLERIEGVVGALADRVRLIAPPGKTGTLFIGQFMFDSKELVRFENVGEPPPVAFTKPEPQPMTEKTRQAMRHIESMLDDELLSYPDTPLTEFTPEQARKRFEDLHLKRVGTTWQGANVTVDPVSIKGYISQERDYGRLLAWYAIRCRQEHDATARAQYSDRFLTMFDYITYIGGTPDSWAGGDGYIEAVFLMRDELAKTGRLTAARAGEIFVRLGGDRIYTDVSVYQMTFRNRTYRAGEQGESCDYIRMSIPRLLMVILLAPDSPEKVRDLMAFSRWMDKVILQDSPGVCDTFKPDSTLFHHQSFMYGYGRGSQLALSRLCYLLAGTPFALSARAHDFFRERTLRHAKLAVRNLMPLTQGGKEGIQPQLNESIAPWMYLALAGSPDGKESPDRMVAAEYLRMSGEHPQPNPSPLHSDLLAACERLKVEATPSPEGCFVFPFGALAIHRQGDWLAQVKGMSKYFYAREAGSMFRYPTYIGYGCIEILVPEDHRRKSDGVYYHDIDFGKPGFDWSRFPGTTAVFLPPERLASKKRIGGSDDPFVGGVECADGNGLFVLSLHGHKQIGLDSFRARKSYFCFGSEMLCLGSGIGNQIADTETGTVLLQEACKTTRSPVQHNAKPLDLEGEQRGILDRPATFLDSRGNGYWVAVGQDLAIRSGLQKSRTWDDKGSSEGRWTSVWLSHGQAPRDAGYQYILKPHCGSLKLAEFQARMAGQNPPYRIHCQDAAAHIVEAVDQQAFAYAIYAARDKIAAGPLLSASKPCAVYVKSAGKHLTVCVADPDMNFADDGFRSIDDWGYSRPSTLKLVLDGAWRIHSTADAKADVSENKTNLAITCRDGMTRRFELSK